MHHKKISRHEVLPVFYDVDPSEVRKQASSFAEVVISHENRLKAETEERRNEWMKKLEGWRTVLKDI